MFYKERKNSDKVMPQRKLKFYTTIKSWMLNRGKNGTGCSQLYVAYYEQ